MRTVFFDGSENHAEGVGSGPEYTGAQDIADITVHHFSEILTYVQGLDNEVNYTKI